MLSPPGHLPRNITGAGEVTSLWTTCNATQPSPKFLGLQESQELGQLSFAPFPRHADRPVQAWLAGSFVTLWSKPQAQGTAC